MNYALHSIAALVLMSITLSGALGQTEAPPSATPEATPAASPTGVPPSANQGQDAAPSSPALDYLYNRRPQEGSAAGQAADMQGEARHRAIAADAVGVNRVEDPEMRSRFNIYLGMSEVSPERIQEYETKVDATTDLLQTGQLFEAWKSLFDLAEFQTIDGSVSRALASRIESIWNMDRASTTLADENRELHDKVRSANRNADVISEGIRDEEIRYQQKMAQINRRQERDSGDAPSGNNLPNGGVPTADEINGPQVPNMVGLEGKLQLTEEYLRSLEYKARIKLNELRGQELLDQAKADFASYIDTLFNSGRFTHVVLAADFYRKLFDEHEYPAEINAQVNASFEISRDVTNMIDVFRHKIEGSELAGAMDALQQAFMTSELHPAVLGVERPLKKQIAEFDRQLTQIRNFIEARDFTRLEQLLTEVEDKAVDFDISKPLAVVNAVKLESRLRLGKAKIAAQQGNLDLAMQEFQAAAQAWPANPELEQNAELFFESQDVENQVTVEFDRLVEEKDYRGIFEKQVAFAPAIRGNEKREQQFAEALEKIKTAEFAAEKANTLMMNGDFIGAWETVELASETLPDDQKLNRMRAELSGRSAEFVAALNKAKAAEQANDLGMSITWYVNAQRTYPNSRIANQAIERLQEVILSDGEVPEEPADQG